LSALIGGDENLIAAHRTAVEQALRVMERRYTQTRIRINNKRPCVKTGNLIVAQFDHLESRELDPHLHTHALVMNLTQAENGKWYSLHNGQIYQNKKRLGRLYQSYLKREVEKLGYQTKAQRHGQFEITGYRREDLLKFSKRRQQIVFEVGSNASWKGREEAWDITRQAKRYLPLEELREKWRREALDLEIVPVMPLTQLRDRKLELQANIEFLLRLSNQDLLLVESYIKDYFQFSDVEVNNPDFQKKVTILEALTSPLVQERLIKAYLELSKAREQEIEVENLQPKIKFRL
jgi:TrwC relaxase